VAVALIESLDRDGRGVAHVEGKALFVEGALPGERVEYSVVKKKPSYELAELEQVLSANAGRLAPACRHFGHCGGCSMQHLEPRAQVAAKQRVLEDALWHIGRVRAESMLAPIHGPAWRYRRRARLSVRRVVKKGRVLVGFHERKSSYVAVMDSCEVLPRPLSDAIAELSALVDRLSIRERMPQVEIAVGDRVTALVLRVLQAPDEADQALLRAYAESSGFQLWLQPAGPESARPFWPLDAPELDYALPEFDVTVRFLPTDFTQVNNDVNRMLVRRAVRLLDPSPGERIGDFFCGLGNFSLPIARCGATVLGVEGSAGLVSRAGKNAELNGLQAKCRFEAANLFEPAVCARYAGFDKVLIDPPREGALELVKSVAMERIKRLVYISCDPATLARDASLLVNTRGLRLVAAGVANMFPHTSHVESMALFEGDGG
jgi:23S rRNA (uracil1939-C5)-methyltransferase